MNAWNERFDSKKLSKMPTFGEYAEQWRRQTAKGKKPGTRRNDKDILAKLPASLTDVPINRITRAMIKEYLFSEQFENTSSVADAHQRKIRAVLSEAMKDKLIDEHPITGDNAIDTGHKKVKIKLVPVTYDQMCIVESEFEPEFRLIIWLCYGLGLRLGAALGVRVGAIRKNGMLRVEDQLNLEVTGKDKLDQRVTGLKWRDKGEYRDIPIAPWLREKIDAHIQEFGITDYFFPRFLELGQPGNFYYRRFRKGRDKAGLPKEFNTKMLRHIYASTNLTNLMPIHELQKYMGHSDVTITVNTYGHLVPGADERAREIGQDAFIRFRSGEETYELG